MPTNQLHVLCINGALKGCKIPESAKVNGVDRKIEVTKVSSFKEATELLRPKIDEEKFVKILSDLLPKGWTVEFKDGYPILRDSEGRALPNNDYGRPELHKRADDKADVTAVETQWDSAIDAATSKPFDIMVTEELVHQTTEPHSADVRWGVDLAFIALRSGVKRIGIRISDHSNLWPPGRKIIGSLKLVIFKPGKDWEVHATKDLFG